MFFKAPLTFLALISCSLLGETPPPHQVNQEASCTTNAFIDAEFLYWQARLDTLNFAQTGVGSQEPFLENFLTPPPGRSHAVDWEWNPGFRVTIGCLFNQRNWEINLGYLWFYTHSNGEISTGPEGAPVTTTFNLLAPANPSSGAYVAGIARANWSLHYQMAALEFKRNYSVKNFFKISPFFSIVAVRQKQRYRLFYNNIILTANGTVFDCSAKFKQSNWGIGPRIGLNATWQFVRSFGIYSKLALSGLWLNYTTRRRDSLVVTAPAPFIRQDDSSANLKDLIHSVKPFIEIAAGLFFDPSVNWSNFKLLFKVGWEAQIWPNQTLYINLYENPDRFDLTLQGLTAKIYFEF